jgi:hypothetical protein
MIFFPQHWEGCGLGMMRQLGRIPWDDTNIEKHNGGCHKRDFLFLFYAKKDVGG